jgi:hypothetical protein
VWLLEVSAPLCNGSYVWAQYRVMSWAAVRASAGRQMQEVPGQQRQAYAERQAPGAGSGRPLFPCCKR